MESVEQRKVCRVANRHSTWEGSRRQIQTDSRQEAGNPLDRDVRRLPAADPGGLLAGEADRASEVLVAEAKGDAGGLELAAQIGHGGSAARNSAINRTLANRHGPMVLRGASLPLIGAEIPDRGRTARV
jgi:hypothetical protein